VGGLPCGDDGIVRYTVHDPIGSYRAATRTTHRDLSEPAGGPSTALAAAAAAEPHRFEVAVARGVLGTVAATRQLVESAAPSRLPDFDSP